ncbi:DsrE family protein [Ferruginibacter paludis]|uniref:DsrE family protein n=1 Tax=Ferruginibacter paludis TaxID=1310417 RepID=UPI0025B4016A|nr:DsrE family protein [Ferruginibacter paludis]MDN3657403.1 DsrE family protein [Ferruginibacter paludis]
MKKIRLCTFFLLTFHFLLAQQPDYRVVFDMSTKDSISQQALIREATLIVKENPDAKLEVVIYGQGLPLVTKAQSGQAKPIQDLMAGKNVTFKVCAFTMKRGNLVEADLLPGVQVVPDGIYEIISKQHEGWGYIKVAH